MSTPVSHPRDPLHGITLETILTQLVERHGWDEMGRRIPIRCFLFDPSIKSSLKFLRKTPWARSKVEDWFIIDQLDQEESNTGRQSAPPA
ncbi:MAG: VF530 family protein [Lentisphaerae bacterium]|nr:VF530 family protein [Lentisphaerota bacterium]